MSDRLSVPTSVRLEARIVADLLLRRTREGRAFVRVRVEVEPQAVCEAGRPLARLAAPCDLVVFGKAAYPVLRRFRSGDRIVASGRLTTGPRGAMLFVVRRIGHYAALTAYRVLHARRRCSGQEVPASAGQGGPLDVDGPGGTSGGSRDTSGGFVDGDESIVAGRILPGPSRFM